MKIVFRFDVSKDIGFGHLSRMVSLAQCFLESSNKECQLYLAVNSDPMVQKYLSHQAWNVIEKGELSDELFIDKILEEASPDLILFDQRRDYSISIIEKWAQQCRLIAIDFIGEMTQGVDLTIIPNDHTEVDLKNGNIFTGLDFTLIGQTPLKMEPKKRQNRVIEHIVVTTGGTDPHGLMNQVYECVKEIKTIQFTFLIGENFKHKEFFNSKMESSNITFKPFEHSELLCGDLVISAFGITPYECLYLNIPILAITYADEQIKQIKKLAQKYCYLSYWGHIHQLDSQSLSHSLEEVALDAAFDNLSYRNKVQKANQNIMDKIEGLLKK